MNVYPDFGISRLKCADFFSFQGQRGLQNRGFIHVVQICFSRCTKCCGFCSYARGIETNHCWQPLHICNYSGILTLKLAGGGSNLPIEIWLLFLQFSSKLLKFFGWNLSPITPPNSEIICGQNVGTKVVCGINFFFEKKAILKIWKKSWVPFRSYLLNRTANPAHLHSNWAGLAVLFSR